jgi:flagellar motor switch protein FliG
VQTDSLVIALKGATPDLREKVFKQHVHAAPPRRCAKTSSRAARALSEVEAEQKEMLKIVRRLADEGQIVLAGGGDEQFV